MMAETEVFKVHAFDWADDFPPLGKGNTLEDGAGFQVPSVLESNKETKSWTEVVISAPTPFDVKVKMNSNVTVSSIIENSNSFDVKNGVAKKIGSETKDVKDVADQTDGRGNRKEILYLQENGGTGNCHGKDIAMGSLEGYSADVVDDEEANVDAVTKPFKFLIKVPRCDDRSLQEEISLAKLQVDEKTRLRDAIQAQIQEKRQAKWWIPGFDYEYAKDENRKARRLVKLKRMEIDSLVSVISKAKNALSIEDINGQIHEKEHMIQHETVSLKQEKQLIREIEQLEHFRDELLANFDSQDEIKQSLEQQNEDHERLKILREELDSLKGIVVRAEAAAVEAEKQYDAENKNIKELQAKSRAANDARQAAYVQLQGLRKKLTIKNKHFFNYKDAAAAANSYSFTGNKKGLYSLCRDQVEKLMELWNTNNEFRQNYVKCNESSTLRRFGTLDGRSLGPKENPPVLPNYAHEGFDRVLSPPANTNLVLEIPVLDLKQETAVKNLTSDDKLPKKMIEHENEDVKAKKPGLVIVAQEMLRKEEDEAKMREPEKKKRQAEKVKRRAELKAQKEAEEKERLKRLKKNEKKKERRKEKRKAAAMDANNTNSRAHEGVDGMISTPDNINLVSQIPILELKQEATVQAVTSGDELPKKTTEHNNEKVMNETPGLVMVPGRDVTDEVEEQADLTKTAKDMLRREEDEAKMREQPILEELAKAEVAREKNQQAEKAQMRAELLAQKEAEEREKVRLKRLKKKERRREKKKAAAMDANDTNSCATVPNTKSTVEVSKNALNKEFSLQKPQAPTRTTSRRLYYRNKINYRQWMWTGLISFVVYILFWLGNLDVFSKINVVS